MGSTGYVARPRSFTSSVQIMEAMMTIGNIMSFGVGCLARLSRLNNPRLSKFR